MAKITYEDKVIGSKFKADDANEIKTSVNSLYDDKVDKVTGKQLSTQDFTTDEKTKLESEVLTNSYTKKIVVIGSSVAYGTGASPLSNGWARRMETALLTRSWTVVNKAVPGSTSTDVINRFTTDAIDENPDVVIIAMSLGNDGINGANPDVIYRNYVSNIYKLVDMCRKAGFKAIVTGVYPKDDYTATAYEYIKSFDSEMESSSIPFINLLGSVDNGSGHWRTGMVDPDGQHPNNTGHDALFRAVPLGIFDRLINSSQEVKISPSAGYLNFNSSTAVTSPIRAAFEATGSFTAGFWVKQLSLSTGTGKVFLHLEGTSNAPRIRNPSGVIVVSTSGDLITSSVNTSDLKWHYVLIRFDYFTNTLKLDIDGIHVGSTTSSDFSGITAMDLGGRPDNTAGHCADYSFKDWYVSRVALNDSQAQQLYNGQALKGSMELFSSFETYNGIYFKNKANSDVLVISKLNAATYDTGSTVDNLQVNGQSVASNYKLSALNTAPASATATGVTGEIRYTATHIYVCTATNTWVRAALATW